MHSTPISQCTIDNTCTTHSIHNSRFTMHRPTSSKPRWRAWVGQSTLCACVHISHHTSLFTMYNAQPTCTHSIYNSQCTMHNAQAAYLEQAEVEGLGRTEYSVCMRGRDHQDVNQLPFIDSQPVVQLYRVRLPFNRCAIFKV